MTTDKIVVFVCSGNYYRSRYAEGMFNHLAPRSGLNWSARSRGLRINSGNRGAMSPFAIDRLTTLGAWSADFARFPLRIEEADLVGAHLIIALKTDEHREPLQRRFSDWIEAIEFWNIDDVDRATPEEALPKLDHQISLLVDRLAQSDLRQRDCADGH